MCRSSPPTASGNQPSATPLHSLRSSHFSRLGSLRSGATACPPAPSLDALEIERCPCRLSIAVRSRSFLPSPSPILQAAPHLKGGGPSPRHPSAVPRAALARVAGAGATRLNRAAPLRRLDITLCRGNQHNAAALNPLPRHSTLCRADRALCHGNQYYATATNPMPLNPNPLPRHSILCHGTQYYATANNPMPFSSNPTPRR